MRAGMPSAKILGGKTTFKKNVPESQFLTKMTKHPKSTNEWAQQGPTNEWAQQGPTNEWAQQGPNDSFLISISTNSEMAFVRKVRFVKIQKWCF